MNSVLFAGILITIINLKLAENNLASTSTDNFNGTLMLFNLKKDIMKRFKKG